jgi:hypothetical protein
MTGNDARICAVTARCFNKEGAATQCKLVMPTVRSITCRAFEESFRIATSSSRATILRLNAAPRSTVISMRNCSYVVFNGSAGPLALPAPSIRSRRAAAVTFPTSSQRVRQWNAGSKVSWSKSTQSHTSAHRRESETKSKAQLRAIGPGFAQNVMISVAAIRRRSL